jgi:epoxyqueuosine reductase
VDPGATSADAGPARLAAELRAVGREGGLAAVGIAPALPMLRARRAIEARRSDGLAADMAFTFRNPPRSTDPSAALPGARSLVVGARRYLREPPRSSTTVPAVAGRVARYSWIDHYQPLRRALEAIADHLGAAGWRARVVADDNALVDREAAYLAGLGWYGKHTNLLLPGAGSWFVLGSVVTDAPLPADRPVADRCGTCERCLPACPTGAIVAPGVLDARRCLAWLLQAPGSFPREHRVALGDRIYGCDDCQEVCPVNHRGSRHDPPGAAEADARPYADILKMLAATDEELLAEWGRWYIPRREPRWVRRNALIVLGNVGDATDAAVLDAITAALAHPDPVVRAHAVWAAARLGRPDLTRSLADDPDPEVAAELVAIGTVEARLSSNRADTSI